jgi:hypothetical protein
VFEFPARALRRASRRPFQPRRQERSRRLRGHLRRSALPQQGPMVSFCTEKIPDLLRAAVLIFVIAGLLSRLCLEHVGNLGAYSIPAVVLKKAARISSRLRVCGGSSDCCDTSDAPSSVAIREVRVPRKKILCQYLKHLHHGERSVATGQDRTRLKANLRTHPLQFADGGRELRSLRQRIHFTQAVGGALGIVDAYSGTDLTSPSRWVPLCLRWARSSLRRVAANLVTLPSALFYEQLEVGASWAFSFRPVLQPDLLGRGACFCI